MHAKKLSVLIYILFVIGLMSAGCAYYTTNAVFVGNNTYEVSAEGATPADAKGRAMMKAADVAKSKGFSHMLVLTTQTVDKNKVYLVNVGSAEYYTHTLQIRPTNESTGTISVDEMLGK